MRIIIAGTGTDVGKTHVTACLAAHARSLGLRVSAYKPVATGVEHGRCEDTEQHAAALGGRELAPTFVYRRPVSPHLAAREEGRPIVREMIRRRADELGALADVLLVELAGGLFTPLDDTSTNAELVEGLLPARLLLVAPDRLGVLHDVGACVRAARASGLVVDALVLSAPSQPDATTGSNAGELERLGLGPIGAVFPRASRDDPRSLTAAVQAWTGLQVRGA